MRDWDARHLAAAAGATLVRRPTGVAGAPGPERASIDSRRIEAGELFVGLRGERSGGEVSGFSGGGATSAGLSAGGGKTAT